MIIICVYIKTYQCGITIVTWGGVYQTIQSKPKGQLAFMVELEPNWYTTKSNIYELSSKYKLHEYKILSKLSEYNFE